MQDKLPAKQMAAVYQSAKAVCGWMTRRCRHDAHCRPGEPPDVVIELHQGDGAQRASKPAAESAPMDIRELCRRMEAESHKQVHSEAYNEYEQRKEEREVRERQELGRRQAMNKADVIASRRRFQKQAWERNWSNGLRPVPTDPGPPLSMDQYMDLFGGKFRAPPYEYLQAFGSKAVFAGMDAWHQPHKSYEQKERHFFAIIRRIQSGFGVDWMTHDELATSGLEPLEWDDKRGPFLSQCDAEQSDLPLEWYDGGQSKKWQQRQAQAT